MKPFDTSLTQHICPDTPATPALRTPWRFTPAELARTLKFHGSIEPWNDETPRVGGYDALFWTADNPLIAQVYIPDWGGSAMVTFPDFRLDDTITPSRHCTVWDLAQQFGASADVLSWQANGRAQSWRSGPTLTYRALRGHLEALGYEFANDTRSAWVKTRHDKDTGRSIALPQPTRPFGRLVLIDAPDTLRCMDLAGKREGDLTEREYHDHQGFAAARAAGYHLVKINDFCQSPSWGNVGHHAWGYFQETLNALYQQGRILTIPATHRDLGPTLTGENFLTPDFLDWHFGHVLQAIAQDEIVPADVLRAHAERFEHLDDVATPVHGAATLGSPRELPSEDDRARLQPQVARIVDDLRCGKFEQGDLRFVAWRPNRPPLIEDERGLALQLALLEEGLLLSVQTRYRRPADGTLLTQRAALNAYLAADETDLSAFPAPRCLSPR